MKKDKKKYQARDVVNFLFEVGILAKTPRSGFHFLGSGHQSVAEHVNRVVYIGYTLAKLDGKADVSKVMAMCLFHDIGEARVSDLNYVHQKYVERKEYKAHEDLAATLPFGEDVLNTVNEYEKRESLEAIIAKDADNLEWILALKEQVDIGNERAKEWIYSAVKRLRTENARTLAKEIQKTDSNCWWFGNDTVSRKSDNWWINRDNGKRKGKK